MIIIQEIEKLNTQKKTAVAVGYFDGMHRGHRQLVSEMLEYAKEKDMISAILTFDMTKLRAERKGKNDLFPRCHTLHEAENMGVELFVDIPFEIIRDMTPENFCKTILSGERSLNAGAVFCGKDFRFGRSREGSVEDLEACGEKIGFSVIDIEDVFVGGEIVSSSIIKAAVESGNIEKANLMLGYPYFISGKVIHGNHLAKAMGFPTANILFSKNVILPRKGVYLTQTIIGKETYKSITNIGTRPTITEDVAATAETHILDFNDDLYGKEIKISFYEFVRPEQKFSSIQELKTVVEGNIQMAREKEFI